MTSFKSLYQLQVDNAPISSYLERLPSTDIKQGVFPVQACTRSARLHLQIFGCKGNRPYGCSWFSTEKLSAEILGYFRQNGYLQSASSDKSDYLPGTVRPHEKGGQYLTVTTQQGEQRSFRIVDLTLEPHPSVSEVTLTSACVC